jgi:hypothetical protein
VFRSPCTRGNLQDVSALRKVFGSVRILANPPLRTGVAEVTALTGLANAEWINYFDSCFSWHSLALQPLRRAWNASSLKMGELSEGCA